MISSAATGTLRDAANAAALNTATTRTSSTVPRRATSRTTATRAPTRKARLTGFEKLGDCHSTMWAKAEWCVITLSG